MADNIRQDTHDAMPHDAMPPIAIIGTGAVGLLAALTLAPLHKNLILVGPRSNKQDNRTCALMMPAIRQLEQLGIWQQICAKAAALARLRIIDATSRLLRAPTVTFHAAEIGEAAFGYNIPNRILTQALSDKVAATANIVWHDSFVKHYQHRNKSVSILLDDGTCHDACLIVAADGRNSSARKAAGITAHQWHYPQMALVLNFSHQLPHQNISHEFHTEQGPFTQVPLPGNRSSLVWVLHPQAAKRLSGLGANSMAGEIETNMQSLLGKVKIDEEGGDWPAQAWPMSGLVLSRFGARCTLLIGEAAHLFPPIGAQGLNLGFRDVADLRHALTLTHAREDIGSKRVIDIYNRRRLDIWGRTGFVHLLNRSLLSDFFPAQLVRSVGLEALRQCSPLRAFMMREGLKPGSGARSLLSIKQSLNCNS